MRQTTTSTHRKAAVALIACWAIALLGIAVLPNMGLSGASERSSAMQEELQALKKIVNRSNDLSEKNKELLFSKKQSEYLLSGGTTGIAGAELQRFLIDRVMHHGGTAMSVQIEPTEIEGELFCISASLSLRIDIKGLRDLLYDLETGLPLLFVIELSVQSNREVAASESHVLDARMLVEGYLSRGKTS